MSTYALTVGGVAKPIKSGTFRIAETANGRNQLTFTVPSSDGSFRPTPSAEVFLTEDATRIFGGNIVGINESGEGGIGWASILNAITAVDFNMYAERRWIYSLKIVEGTLKAALEAILPWLTGYAVTLDPAQVDGPTIPEMSIEWRRVSDVLDELSKLSGGYIWDISYYKVLSMKLPANNLAPFNLTVDDGNVYGDMSVEYGMEDYGNRVVVRFTAAAISAWAFLTATQNFADNEEVTIGSITYRFKNALENGNDVLIGADLAESFDHLVAAVDAPEDSPNEGVIYGTGTDQNSAAYVYPFRAGTLACKAREAGEGGNNIDVSDTCANASWRWEGNQVTSTLLGGKNEELTNWVETNDLAEQGTFGLWEKIIEAPEIRDYGTAQARAEAELVVARASRTFKKTSYLTDQQNIHPGMVQTVTLPPRGLSGDFLVTDVEISEASNWVRRRVTLQGGTILGNRWIDDAKRALGTGSSGSSGAFVILGGSSGGSGGGTSVISASPPVWFGGGEDIRTRIATAGTWYRGRNGGEVILDSYKLPTKISMSLLMIADAGSGGNAQCRVVAGSGNWADQTVVSGTVTPVTDGADWVWQSVEITPRTGVWAYRIEMSSSVNNSDVGFRAYLLW